MAFQTSLMAEHTIIEYLQTPITSPVKTCALVALMNPSPWSVSKNLNPAACLRQGYGMVCIAGNTAHAAAPYHGAGAGGAVLAQLLDTAGSSISIDRSGAINAVSETCNASAVAGRGGCTNGGRMIPGGATRRLRGGFGIMMLMA